MATIGFVSAATEPAFNGDDARAIAPLQARGHRVVPHVWDGGAVPDEIDALVIRACWDYHRKPVAFRAWLDALARSRVTVVNETSVLQWNLDKLYLREVAAAGIPIPRTVFVASGPAPDLAGLLAAHDFTDVVVKPAISLSADRTWRCDRATATARQDDFAEVLRDRAVLVQAFLPEVTTDGELSLLFFDGMYSHAVRKRPRVDDFRVQAEHGGTREACEPSPAIIDQARECLARVPGRPTFARVDGIVVRDTFVLMELELIDPVLFLAYAPDAAERFAAAIDAAIARDAARG